MDVKVKKNDETKRAFQQYIFPFTLEGNKIETFVKKLLEEDFVFLNLKDMDQQNQFYGGHKISHRKLEKYFMPYIEPILFPGNLKQKEGLRRFTKNLDIDCTFESPFLNTPFVINSIDIFICPFHIGMMNLRVTLPEGISYNDVLYFGDTFRILEPIADDEEKTKVGCKKNQYEQVKDFIFNELLPPMEEYMDEEQADPTYFGSLPFFIDERMYVISYIAFPDDRDITKNDLFRASELNGYDNDGEAYIGSSNPDYIERYYRESVYDRWGEETYYVTSMYHFACVTKATGNLEQVLASQMYGHNFYTILLTFYYKMVLLKLVHEHSKIDIEKDQSNTEQLIFMITEFSAKYLFNEVNSTVTGKELFKKTEDTFRIAPLYKEVKETLSYLYQNQDKLSGKRSNYLLQILTIYTVISGIFGMNLYIGDWKGKLPWKAYMNYTFFEWVAVFVTISGLAISSILGFFFLKKWLQEKKSRKKRML
ncbi:hypothetical protein SRABI96_02881 [Peribacillus sp. Bi96]|uniref:hypothetical protein n=1 Tax=unclassified Peribacillus TaxID=2675266 RepID=UPI001DFFE180|nr:hypothetical protein [Peribacillus sp. Bi96]CAH0239119.1 hypothetical protein SRABI96_02881 [Peribacillus sp. Bi96]